MSSDAEIAGLKRNMFSLQRQMGGLLRNQNDFMYLNENLSLLMDAARRESLAGGDTEQLIISMWDTVTRIERFVDGLRGEKLKSLQQELEEATKALRDAEKAGV